MENNPQSLRSRIGTILRNALSRVHPFVLAVTCLGILIACLTGMYVTGSLHSASRWTGAMLACTSVIVVLQKTSYKESLQVGWIRVFGTFLGALIAYIYLLLLPFSVAGLLGAVVVLGLFCMLFNIYNNSYIATMTLVIILLVSQASPQIDPAMNCLLRFFESAVGVGVGIALIWAIERWNRIRQRLLHIGHRDDGQPVDMDTMPLRWGHIRVLIVASLGQVTGAALATLIGIILPMIQLVRHPELSSFVQGAVACMSLAGIMIGSILFGAWSDKRGYLFFFRLCPIIILAASLFAFFSDKPGSLAVALFVMGLGIGGGYSLDSDYISEIMPRRWRLTMVGVAKAASSIGNILTAVICFYLLREWNDPQHWNRLLLLVSTLAAIMILCRIRFEQSPGWLIAHGRPEEADRAIRYFLGADVVAGEIHRNPPQRRPGIASWSALLSKKNLPRLIFSGVPWACEGFGVYGIGIFLPVLIMSIGLSASSDSGFGHIVSSVRLTAQINLFVALGFIAGLFLVNRWYHVRTQTWGFVLSAAGLLLLLLGHVLHGPAWICLTGFMLFELFINAGPHLMTFIIPPQIYPVADRGTGTGIAAACGKLGAVIGVLFIPLLLEWGGAATVLIVTIAVLVAGAIVTIRVGRRMLPRPDGTAAPEIRHDS